MLLVEDDPLRRKALCRLVLNEYDRQWPEFEQRMKRRGMTDEQIYQGMKGYAKELVTRMLCAIPDKAQFSEQENN